MASNAPSETKYERQKPLLFYALTAIGFFILLIFGIRAFIAHEEMTGTIELAFALLTLAAVMFVFEQIGSKAQRALTLSEEELIKRNDELRMLLSSISEVVFSMDLRGTLIKIFQPYDHGEFIDLPDEFIGRPYRDVLPEQLVRGIEHAIGQLNENDAPTAFTYTLGDGPHSVWFLAKIALMKSPEGAARGYTVIARNITELKLEENKRKVLEEDLIRSEQKAIMGRIAAGIAHEINNPASAITSDLSTLDVLIRKFPDGKEKEEVLEIIGRDHAAIGRITSIVSAVKGAYRPQKWHCIDLTEEIELQLTLLHKEYKDRITIEREYGDIPDVEAYGSEVGQIILNVLKNAVDAIEDKGTITIRTKEKNGRVSVAIVDTGKGIAGNELPHIFEPFYTTKEVGKGTGLGLSISYSNALRHNGILYVDATAPGRGTTVILELPVKRGNHEKI